ncbi:MAG: heme-copper oxidase subunit III [Actinobacteria bacterium]|nr:MAG: heme-copper oxidase subunit III [Actinomycetota bacterium]
MSQAAAVPVESRRRGPTPTPILGMVLFVASEAMFFAALFGAYFTVYAQAPVWPPLSVPIPDLPIPTILTVILVSSSVVLQTGVRAARRGDTRVLTRRLAVTVGMGVAFLGLQGYDYSRLTFGIRDGIYPSLFYVMTGLHMAHVMGGVVFLWVVLQQARSGQLSLRRHEPVEAAAIYWHFVDIVWLGLFTAFYLLTQSG